MANLLLKIFVKNHKNIGDNAVREQVGKMSQIVCIVLNALLATAKIAVGLIFSALSILADGLNNLTDCGSNVVSLIGIKLASKPADSGHPYGHRRMEYIAGMIVAFSVLFLALELGVESVTKTISLVKGEAEEQVFGAVTFITLGASLIIKFWMFLFNGKLGKMYSSELLKATAIDSISDFFSTLAVLAALVIGRFTGINTDGVMGIVVSVFVAFCGVKILKSTVNELLGEAPSDELIQSIIERIKSFDGVQGVHDLYVHNYGPEKFYASVHVEVDSAVNVCESHDLLDRIEHDFSQNTNIVLVTHLDPITVGDPILDEYKSEIDIIVKQLDEHFSIHDFRAVKGTRTNLIFDVAVHFDTKLSDKFIRNYIQTEISKLHSDIVVVPTVEKQLK